MTAWEPTPQTRADMVTPAAARALHGLLNRAGNAPEVGDRLPLLWHWLAFLPQSRQDNIGTDGHPRTGGFLPPNAGRRRMYAGGHVTQRSALFVGANLERTSVVSDVTHKRGRSGDLLFVTVDHTVISGHAVLTDRNDIVYKDPSPTATERVVDPHLDDDVVWGTDVEIDPTVLFRFSALTYNAHRIHYDRAYATGVEGYPGLVVHGPLQAILLADAVSRAFPDRTATDFTFRSVAPAFDDQALQLRVRATASGDAELTAYRAGVQTMKATAAFRETL